MKKVLLYTDGGSRGNPGRAGSGAVLLDDAGNVLGEVKCYLGHATNNVAEYEAVRIGLEMVAQKYEKDVRENLLVVVRMDSELVCRQLIGRYRVKDEKLKILFSNLRAFYTNMFPHIAFEHVRREHNAHADRLANEAMDEAVM